MNTYNTFCETKGCNVAITYRAKNWHAAMVHLLSQGWYVHPRPEGAEAHCPKHCGDEHPMRCHGSGGAIVNAPAMRRLTDPEVNTILCAIRAMYDGVNDADDSRGPQPCSAACDHFDEAPPLSRAEADVLAEEFGLGMCISTGVRP